MKNIQPVENLTLLIPGPGGCLLEQMEEEDWRGTG